MIDITNNPNTWPLSLTNKIKKAVEQRNRSLDKPIEKKAIQAEIICYKHLGYNITNLPQPLAWSKDEYPKVKRTILDCWTVECKAIVSNGYIQNAAVDKNYFEEKLETLRRRIDVPILDYIPYVYVNMNDFEVKGWWPLRPGDNSYDWHDGQAIPWSWVKPIKELPSQFYKNKNITNPLFTKLSKKPQ